MAKNDLGKAMRNFVIRIVLLVVTFILITNISNLIMTWVIRSFLNIENVYLSSELQLLGTLLIALIVLLIVFIFIYRKRKRELTTLCDGIERVANGDYETKISYGRKDSMAHVYKDFNRMTAELKSLEFVHKDFINNFSHEFKTPIASINGFSSLMLEKNISEEEKKVYLEIIRDESERLSNLANNTILLTKLTSQDFIADKEEYNLDEQLRQCVIILSNEWTKKNQTVTGEFDEVRFSGNHELMQHLWLNIIGNAVKYTPDYGEIMLSLKMGNADAADSGSEKFALVSIKDNGIGMDENTMTHLFDPYFQANKGRTGTGLGLGLSISRQIVSICGGTISVNSRQGEGSEFLVRLPLGGSENG